ncbi:hypothetical protein ACH4FE_35785 [Streptomyces celluloflavus]|uniref:hypothetical protein n=1 Tax=Streptomyces celluloflavus TaxID=58344 RepID=UPI00378DAC5F
MSIIAATTSAPLRPQAAADGINDVLSDAFGVFEGIQGLAKIGVWVSVHVAPGTIEADVEISPDSIDLLPGLAHELESAGLSYTQTGVQVHGTMCQGTVDLRIAVDRADLSGDALDALVTAIGLAPQIGGEGR